MKTFGLDLSTVATGWSFFDGDKLLHYGLIAPPKDLTESEKYFYISQSVATLIRILRPTELSVEDTYYSKDPTVLKKLNRIAGQIMFVWYTFAKKEPHYYMASSARNSIGIKGNSTKEEVTEAVNKFFKKRGSIKDHNIADAIVTGYHHVNETKDDSIEPGVRRSKNRGRSKGNNRGTE